MIAIDTQILVYAHKRESSWHVRARDRIAELANSGAKWGIPLHCLIEFYALATNPRLYKPPSTPTEALAQVDAWLEAPTLVVLGEDTQTWVHARALLDAAQIAGPHAYDARIAAVCLQHGVTELWTNDRDFLQYPALRVRNPLIDIQPTHARERRAVYSARARRKRSPR